MTSRFARVLRRLVSVFSTEPRAVGMRMLMSLIAWIAVAASLTLVVRWLQSWPWTEPPFHHATVLCQVGWAADPGVFLLAGADT